MSFQPPVYTFSVVSLYPSSGKSCLCKRLIDSNWDNYQTFLNASISSIDDRHRTWFYWGSIKHRRFDEKREAIFHFIEQNSTSTFSSSTPDDNDSLDGDLKRLATLTFRFDQSKTFQKDKVTIDGFLCIYDICSNSSLNEFVSLVQILLKTRRPVIVVTTKNDLVDDQSSIRIRFENKLHGSFSNLSIVHTSSHEHVNIQSVLELALYACDETTRKSNRNQFQPPNYNDAWKNEQSLKHVIQTEYRALLNRHVPDFRLSSWQKFYDRWQHHTTVQTFLDMFGKEQAQCLYHEHIDELKRIYRQNLIDERLIPIIENLIIDPKLKLSRNWDFVRSQMQKNARYSSTVIETSLWSDFERNSTTTTLCIPEDLLDTIEARQRFEIYVNHRQIEQTRRLHCRSFFDLLTRFAEAGLIHYGDSYEKDSVYFLGRESFEALNGQDRLKIFSLHQSYLFRLLSFEFVELLFESLQIFIKTFDKMNLASKFHNETNFHEKTLTTLTIDEIFHEDIIEQIKDDPRFKALEKRETDRQRLMMCHCHFLYDCLYHHSTSATVRSFTERRRSSKRRKSSSCWSLTVDEQFCPYTKKLNEENSSNNGKDFQIVCPMENKCGDIRILKELSKRFPLKSRKNFLVFAKKEKLEKFRISIDSNFDEQIRFFYEENFRSTEIDGCLLLSSSLDDRSRKFCAETNFEIPIVEFFDEINGENLKTPIERLILDVEKSSIDLRILICFMCGGEKNDVEMFLGQLSSRFTLTALSSSSFLFNAVVGRTNRKVEFVCFSFHSLLSSEIGEFDGFILVYDRDRTAAVRTMTYLEKHISNVLKVQDEENKGRRRPIYLLSCVKEFSGSVGRRTTNRDSTQFHQGTIKTFVEAHLFLFLHQCASNLNEELFLDVQTFFDRDESNRSENSMTTSVDRLRLPIVSTSKSNEHSPKHRFSSLTPTNSESICSYRSFPHLSQTKNVGESTIVPTTPVDSSASISTSSTSDSAQIFQKSTSMKFAKLIEHPTNGTIYKLTNGNQAQRKNFSTNETKFQFGRNRNSGQVKVPLATPEIVEINELLSTSNDASIPRGESSIDSSSDERVHSTSVTSVLQRKSSDRKSKRVRAKINENVVSPSNHEIQKKLVSDDDILQDDDKQHQKKKRRPSLKRRKRFFNDQTQTDSGIDSRMDSKDSNKVNITPEPSLTSNVIASNEEDSSLGDCAKDSKNASIEELGDRPAANWIRRQLQHFAQSRREKNESKSRYSTATNVSSSVFPLLKTSLIANVQSQTNVSPLSSVENSSHHLPVRLKLNSFPLSEKTSIPLFIEKCIRFIEEHGLTIEGLYRISGYKNQVEFIIQKLIEDPNCDLNALQIPASAVATALKDMMRKLDEPILSLEQFDECQSLTVEQLREQQFEVVKKALSRSSELKYRTNKSIFKHLHFVAQHSTTTHMDSSNLAVLWWPNLFQPQFHDLRTAEQICQKAKPLVQTMIDHFEIIFSTDS